MSTNIKHGTRIRAVRDSRSYADRLFPKGTELVFFGLSEIADGDGFDWKAGPPDSAPEGDYLVSPADFEVAPLDVATDAADPTLPRGES